MIRIWLEGKFHILYLVSLVPRPFFFQLLNVRGGGEKNGLVFIARVVMRMHARALDFHGIELYCESSMYCAYIVYHKNELCTCTLCMW